MPPNVQALLSKVAALRALAARASTPAEAAAAAARAEAIIARYQLDEAEVEAAGASTADEPIGRAPDPLWVGPRRVMWVFRLAAVLAKHYGCYAYEVRATLGTRTTEMSLRIVGRPSDVAICRDVFVWARVEIARLASAERVAARAAFAQGCVSGFRFALREQREATMRERRVSPTSGAAMVLVSRASAAMAWAKESHTIGKGKAQTVPANHDAFARGRVAGSKLRKPGAALSKGTRAKALPPR